MQEAIALEMVLKFLMICHIISMSQIQIPHTPHILQSFHQRRRKSGRIHQNISLWTLNKITRCPKGTFGMIATMVDIFCHQEGKLGLNFLNIPRFGYSPDRRSGTRQQSLHCGCPFWRTSGLLINSRLAILLIENLWSHPATSITINTATIYIEITTNILGASLG